MSESENAVPDLFDLQELRLEAGLWMDEIDFLLSEQLYLSSMLHGDGRHDELRTTLQHAAVGIKQLRSDVAAFLTMTESSGLLPANILLIQYNQLQDKVEAAALALKNIKYAVLNAWRQP